MTIDVRIDGDLAKILAGEVQAAEAAVTAAIHKAGEGIKRDLRAQINGARLGRRLANAVRLQIYPEQGRSLSAAAWVFARPGKGGSSVHGEGPIPKSAGHDRQTRLTARRPGACSLRSGYALAARTRPRPSLIQIVAALSS